MLLPPLEEVDGGSKSLTVNFLDDGARGGVPAFDEGFKYDIKALLWSASIGILLAGGMQARGQGQGQGAAVRQNGLDKTGRKGGRADFFLRFWVTVIKYSYLERLQ